MDLERLSVTRPRTTAMSVVPRRATPRVVVIEHDPEMRSLLCDILAGDYEAVVPGTPITIADIDDQEPDVILVGTVDGATSSLTPDQIAGLAKRHMRLHRVPTVLLSARPGAVSVGHDATVRPEVTVIPLPTDMATILAVLASVTDRRTALPEVCVHGFDVMADRCCRC
jgi:hypothetical protein